jgi:hypothetical protein
MTSEMRQDNMDAISWHGIFFLLLRAGLRLPWP